MKAVRSPGGTDEGATAAPALSTRLRRRTPDSGRRTGPLLAIIVVGLLSLYPLRRTVDKQLGSMQSQREELDLPAVRGEICRLERQLFRSSRRHLLDACGAVLRAAPVGPR